MKKYLLDDDYKTVKRNVVLAIPLLFILAGVIHFLYELTGKMQLIGAIMPVNESVAEHVKLASIPIIIWWVISYFIVKKRAFIDFRKWIFCAAISSLIASIVIVTFYYTYTGALGIKIFIVDISSLVFALIIGQSIALHIYKHIRITNGKFYIGILIIIAIIALTIIFTFYPPHLPIFKDANTGFYGIQS